MKVLVVALLGSAGDIHPHIGIAQELKERGHEVVFICQSQYEATVRSHGFGFIGSATALERDGVIDALQRERGLAKARLMHRTLSEAVVRWFELVVAQVDRDTVLFGDIGNSLFTRLISEKCMVPYVTCYVMPAALMSRASPPAIKGIGLYRKLPYPLRSAIGAAVFRGLIGPLMASIFKPLYRQQGWREMPKALKSLKQWIYAPPHQLALFPAWYGPAAKDWPSNLVHAGFPLYTDGSGEIMPAELEDFLAAGEPPVVFTPDKRMILGYRSFFEHAVAALESLGLRGVFLGCPRELLPPALPAKVYHASFVSLARLLPRSKALVQHGGVGTTSHAFAAGIRQLVVPGWGDQFDNAHIVEQLGCGLELKARTAESLAEHLERLLSEAAFAQNCERIRKQVEPAAVARSRAADAIEQAMAAAHPSPRAASRAALSGS